MLVLCLSLNIKKLDSMMVTPFFRNVIHCKRYFYLPFVVAMAVCLTPNKAMCHNSDHNSQKESQLNNNDLNKANSEKTEFPTTKHQNATQSTCRCPVLEKAHLSEIYSKGTTYDTFRGYIPHTKRNLAREARKSIERADIKKAYKNKDGTCTCWYVVLDSNDGQLDELGLEEYESKRQNKKVS